MGEEHAIQMDLFFTLDSTREIHVPGHSQETSPQMYTRFLFRSCDGGDVDIFKLEMKANVRLK